jgi:hypothetical protein
MDSCTAARSLPGVHGTLDYLLAATLIAAPLAAEGLTGPMIDPDPVGHQPGIRYSIQGVVR